MHRLIARLLLLFALAGTVAPSALAITTAPEHSCCRRNAAHHCAETSANGSGETVVRNPGCCHGDCGRAVTTIRWAHAQPLPAQHFLQRVALARPAPHAEFSVPASFRSQSPRAPPAL